MKVRDTNHVTDFRDLCPRLSPRGSFGESRRNGIWAIHNDTITFIICIHYTAYVLVGYYTKL